MKSFLVLIGGAILLWAILLGPGWMLQGEQVWCQSLTALGLCLVPTVVSLSWTMAARKTPELQLAAILGGSGIRLGVTIGGALALHYSFPETFPDPFFMWVGAFYLGTLCLEVVLALRVRPTSEPSEPADSLSSAR